MLSASVAAWAFLGTGEPTQVLGRKIFSVCFFAALTGGRCPCRRESEHPGVSPRAARIRVRGRGRVRAPPVSITLPDDKMKTGVQRDRVSYHFGAAQAFSGDCKHPAIRRDEFQFPLYESLFVAIYAAGFAHVRALLPSAELAVGQPGFVHRPALVYVPECGLSRARVYAWPTRGWCQRPFTMSRRTDMLSDMLRRLEMYTLVQDCGHAGKDGSR